jgi:Na+-transporting methylmalonyl-CoA/oxaloacetate decarboxylase beta subunit
MDISSLDTIISKTGLVHIYWGHVIMWLIGFAFIYLAIKKNYVPLSWELLKEGIENSSTSSSTLA